MCIYNRFRNIPIELRDISLIRDVTAALTNQIGDTAVRSEILTAFEKELMKIEIQ